MSEGKGDLMGTLTNELLRKKEQVTRFFKNIKGTMEALIKNYIGKKVPISFHIGSDMETSRTNQKTIEIVITQTDFERYSMDDIARRVRFDVGHECQHVKSSVMAEFSAMKNTVVKNWMQIAKDNKWAINVEFAKNVAHYIGNSLEDGRIENIMCNDYPGMKKHRRWFRTNEWLETKIEDFDEQNALTVILSNIHSVSVIGLMIQDFEKKYKKKSEEYKLMMKCLPHIQNAVAAPTCKDCMDCAFDICKILEDVIMDGICLTPDNSEIMKQMQDDLDKLLNQMNDQNFGDGSNERKNEGPVVSVLKDNQKGGKGSNFEQNNDIYMLDLRTEDPQLDDSSSGNDEGSSESKDSEVQSEDAESNNSNADSSTPEGSNLDKNGDSGVNDGSEGKNGNMSQSETQNNNENCSNKNNNGQESKNICSDTSKTNGKDGQAGSEERTSSKFDSSEEGASSSKSDGLEEGVSSSKGNGVEEQSQKDSDKRSSDEMQRSQDAENTLGKESVITQEELCEILNQLMQEAKNETESDAKTLIETSNAIDIAEIERKAQSGDTSLTKEEARSIANRFGDRSYVENKVCEGGYYPMIDAPAEIKTLGENIHSKIENIVNSLSTPDREEVYEGEVDATGLFKFCIGEYDVFKEEGEPRESDIACFLLKDNSGSMSGTKENACCTQLAILEEGLRGLVKMKIASFSAQSKIEHYTIKDWDDEDTTNYTWSYHQKIGPSGGNHDAYSIMVATEELLKRTENQKLLIVLSDGAPCCDSQDVRAAVRSAREKGVFVISLFFGYNDFAEENKQYYQDMYEKYYIGTTPDKIGFHLERLLEIFMETT